MATDQEASVCRAGMRPAGTGCAFADGPCLGVVMPVFNEVRTLGRILEKILLQPCVKEVIAVDDASSDGTWECLKGWEGIDPRVRLMRHERNRGKGAAIRTALEVARSEVVVIQDGDLEYDPSDYGCLLAPILRGETGAVYGTRLAGQGNAFMNPWHAWSNRILTAAANLLTGQNLTDEATCYKMVRRDILQGLDLKEDGFGFCPEVTAKLTSAGVRIQEVPIRYVARSRAEGKKLRFRHSLEAVVCLFRYAGVHGRSRRVGDPGVG